MLSHARDQLKAKVDEAKAPGKAQIESLETELAELEEP